MTKNSPKIYQLVHISVTFSSRIFKQSQKNIFCWKFCLELPQHELKLRNSAEPSFFIHMTSNFKGSLTALPSSGGNKIQKLDTFLKQEFFLNSGIRLKNN